MIKLTGAHIVLLCALLSISAAAGSVESAVPEPFRDFDDNSSYAIGYDDLTAVLKTVVVDTGRSTRKVAEQAPDITGTRMKAKIKRTANEGNRFYFETFKDDENAQQFLRDVQASLEHLPEEAPLKHFSRDEQLAYWLNLYNVTVLNEIIAVYPKRNLKKLFKGKKSILEKKSLTVAGIPLSLNDIQFTILKENFDNNPLVVYGLYQGIVGAPNIRKTAYTGGNVWQSLEDNAYEFVNSNRGTYTRDEKTFRVSRFYERSSAYFPQFEADLTKHLSQYLQGKEQTALQAASRLKADIDDWDVTDLGGSRQRIGGSLADSRAALLDSVRSTVPSDNAGAGGGVLGAAAGYGSSSMASKGKQMSLARIDPGLLTVLHDIDDRRMEANLQGATVTIEDVEDEDEDEDKQSPDEPEPDAAADDNESP